MATDSELVGLGDLFMISAQQVWSAADWRTADWFPFFTASVIGPIQSADTWPQWAEKVGAKIFENFICRPKKKLDATHDISPKAIRFSFVLISDMAPFQRVISLRKNVKKKKETECTYIYAHSGIDCYEASRSWLESRRAKCYRRLLRDIWISLLAANISR